MNPMITVPIDCIPQASLVLSNGTSGTSDTLDLKRPMIGVMALGAGTLVCDTGAGITRTLVLPAGVQFALQIKRVRTTGTTAANFYFFPTGQ
jgi:hypothetical protein